MKSRPEWGEVLRCLAGCAEAAPSAVAMVLATRGSTPLPAGAQAALRGSGLLAGTVGGGALEAETLRRAGMLGAGGAAEVFEFPLHGPGGDDPRPICGGSVRILVQPLSEAERRVYLRAWEARQRRQRGVLEVCVGIGEAPAVKTRWWSEAEIAADQDSETAASLRAALGRSSVGVAAGAEEIPQALQARLCLPVRPQPRLIIGGAGHVGQALAGLAVLAGFAVVVVDDRPEWLQASAFPEGVQRIEQPIAAGIRAQSIDADTFVALVTRGHLPDAEALAACLHSPAAYIGMIGSKRKAAMMRERFLTAGLAGHEALKRVHAPIGLPIGAVTAPEIAVSILAQMIAVRRGAETGAGREGRQGAEREET